ncbi:MAG: S-layer homology domain-containing protein [Clostridia bacterium]|nr:S-layer homology domain-containing protein [Clostridia bacterium]
MRTRRVFSLLLTVSMIVSLVFTSAFAVGVSAAETDPKKIDKIIVDFRNEAEFSKNGEVYKHNPTTAEPDPDTGGRVSFSEEKNAMRIEYAESKVQVPFRVMTKIKGLTDEYKYWVVVYQAKTDKPYSIYLHNSPAKGVRVDVVTDGKDTDGKWVVSDAFDISLVSGDASILSRWKTGATVNTLNFKTDDTSAEFYVKEYGFFKSKEDAAAYYAAVDLEKPASEYQSTAQAATAPTTSVAGNGTFAVTTYPAAEPAGTSVGTTTSEKLPEPVIMDLSSLVDVNNSGVKFTDHAEQTEGDYTFVTLADGTKALQLKYCPYGNWKPYRTMPAFTEANKVTTDHKYVRITYMTTDVMANTITLTNNANGQIITLVENTAASQGEWVRSNAVFIDEKDILTRYNKGMHCTIIYTSGSATSEIYIKELAFFASEAQAYEYYGDSEVVEASMFSAMTFGQGGSGTTAVGDTWGVYSVNDGSGTLDITYAETTNHRNAKYMAKVKFIAKGGLDSTYRYVRVAYAADQPETVTGAGMYLYNDKIGNQVITLEDNLVDTDGKYVLGDVAYLHDDMTNRFAASGDYSNTMHNSLITNVNVPGATYSIKALYFFPTRAAAEAFELPTADHKITINGNDISQYRIVIAEDAPVKVVEAANAFVKRVYGLTDVMLPVVTDDTAETAFEILVGPSSRAKSTARIAEMKALEQGSYRHWAYLDGDTVVIGAILPYNVTVAVETYLKAFLFDGLTEVPDEIKITDKHEFELTDSAIALTNFWSYYANVEDPEHFTEDFDVDDGYFAEENGASDWSYSNGVMTTDTDDYALSFIHVYEPDVTYSAKLKYTKAGSDGEMGLMLRYTSDYAWVKAGYDFEAGEWYIKSREGLDFFEEVLATASMTLTPDTWYELTLTVDDNTVKLSVNGTEVLNSAAVSQTTPGRIAVYANDAAVSIDDVDVLLLSGEGTIWKDVAHTKLPDESYREGGSVFEMNDGSLIYTHHSNTTFKSLDNGATWTRTDKWTDTYGYVNILRLNNGDWLKIATKDGYKISQTSSDDGKTWVDGGRICQTPFRGDAKISAGAGNMNDKINQSGTTNRIFYSQNYETTISYFSENNDGVQRKVFCEFYYSDDNGKTWTKSDTDSWEIEGNETQTHFGECKILECADGTLRMYNSWNRYGCIVYSESYDNGATWGPLVEMKEFYCSCSSMQFVRDPYADNATTYYMVWVYSEPTALTSGMTRARLSLAKSTDGKEWEFLGDVWRWESNYSKGGAFINHVVDPFIKVTEDYVLVGSGFSEHTALSGEPDVANWHQAQRQHIYSIPKASLPEGEPLSRFADVDSDDSYFKAVEFAANEGLFNGTAVNTFSPDLTMTRSMFVTVLGRLDGFDTENYPNVTFSDVVKGSWYASYVQWAAANGIVNGIGNGLYGINENVTVEQALTILARYNNFAAGNATGKTAASFSDGANVSDWAKEGVEWAVANGIYEGENGALNATAPASRATVATMFYNYVNVYGK